MGYKSVIRSMSAAANKAAREQDRALKRQQRQLEKLQQKMIQAEEKLNKIFMLLDDEYAKGKFSKDKYNNLKKRKIDITLDSVVIGKTPFISLAKRYVTGKIDRKEFLEMQKDILPLDLLKEKKELKNRLIKFKEKLNDFRNNCNNIEEDKCQKCNSKKSFFNSIKKIENLTLCKKCRKSLAKLQKYPGFLGKYFRVEPMTVSFGQLDNDLIININLQEEHFL